jgi:hypothetical protein
MYDTTSNTVENKINEISALSNKTRNMTLTQLEATLASLGEIIACSQSHVESGSSAFCPASAIVFCRVSGHDAPPSELASA